MNTEYPNLYCEEHFLQTFEILNDPRIFGKIVEVRKKLVLISLIVANDLKSIEANKSVWQYSSSNSHEEFP